MSSAGPDRIVLDDDDDDEHGRQYEVQMLVEQLKEESGQAKTEGVSESQRRQTDDDARRRMHSAQRGVEVLSDDES